MPKNNVNLNALPLGEIPDGGLITLPDDKLTIRNQVIIQETSENGKKVVKLYRQDDGPQRILPAPQQQKKRQQGIKRPGSAMAQNQKKRKKGNQGGRASKLTADQERRFRGLVVERKKAAEELGACAAEREMTDQFRAAFPREPDLGRRYMLNNQRQKEAQRRSQEIGESRKALSDELFAETGDTGDWEGQGKDEGLIMGHDEPLGIWGQPLGQPLMQPKSHMQSHTTLFNEQNSGLGNFGYHGLYKPHVVGFQDQSRQFFTEAPGYQNNLLGYHANSTLYEDTKNDVAPENKIHPSRLSLMNSSAPIPRLLSTEPKIHMKVTGENMVPIARSRMASRAVKTSSKQERKSPEPGEIQQLAPNPIPAHFDVETALPSSPSVGNQISSYDSVSKLEDAMAWLDANFPLKQHSAPGTTALEHIQGPRIPHGQVSQADLKLESVQGISIKQNYDVEMVMNLGLQDCDDGSYEPALGGRFEVYQNTSGPDIRPGIVNIKKEPIISHAQAVVQLDEQVQIMIKKESLVDPAEPYNQSCGEDFVIIKQEPIIGQQHATYAIQKENMHSNPDREELEDRLARMGTDVEVIKKVVEYSEELSPRKRALVELPVNAATVHEDNAA